MIGSTLIIWSSGSTIHLIKYHQVVRVAVFAEGVAADEARAAGSDIVGGDELIEEIKNGYAPLSFFFLITIIIDKSHGYYNVQKSLLHALPWRAHLIEKFINILCKGI